MKWTSIHIKKKKKYTGNDYNRLTKIDKQFDNKEK